MRKNQKSSLNYSNRYLYIAIFLFLVKVIIIFSINPKFGLDIGNGQGFLLKGILNGSDGENYLTGFLALKNDGLFSQNPILSYFPAGYPLLIFFISIFGTNWTLTILSILQSALFSFAVYYLVHQLNKTKLQNITLPICLVLLFNPTLTLSSLVIGYESITASAHLIVLGILVKDLKSKDGMRSNSYKLLILVSMVCSIISFLQPRLILGVLIVIFYWILNSFKSNFIHSLLMALFISLILPAALVYRNVHASNLFAVSTNLANTMNLGAGDFTTGSYWAEKKGVQCNLNETEKNQDLRLIGCILKWYQNNPKKSFLLFLHKSVYLWSPWIGPQAEGTSGRNPWLRYGPFAFLESKESIMKVINGNLGKFISILWETLSMVILLYGLIRILKLKNVERKIAIVSIIFILTNWMICLFTIGDNRFRLPISGISIFLQVVGWQFLLTNIFLRNKGKKPDKFL